jgi:hypothetical protein
LRSKNKAIRCFCFFASLAALAKLGRQAEGDKTKQGRQAMQQKRNSAIKATGVARYKQKNKQIRRILNSLRRTYKTEYLFFIINVILKVEKFTAG